MPEYKWHPIEDLNDVFLRWSDSDLKLLTEKWINLKTETSTEILTQILDEIKREWAIETGKVEGLYTLTRGITKTLIQYGINPKYIRQDSSNLAPNELIKILEDQYEVIEGLMDYVGQSKPLTLHYIRQMHEIFTRHQHTTEAITPKGEFIKIPLVRGKWKEWPNNPLQVDKTVHEYCPPEQVQIEMERLLNMHEQHMALNVSPEVEAAFLHHRFTQIHPFQDGNGRVARALASLVFLRANRFPFVVKDEQRGIYIDVLEQADTGDLQPLIEFMIENQEELLFKALTEAQRIDITNELNNIQEESSQYYDSLRRHEMEYGKANNIILDWVEIANELLLQFKEKLSKIKTLTGTLDEGFNFIFYFAIHGIIDFPSELEIMEEGKQVTFAINFENLKVDDLRLYICTAGLNGTPTNVYALLKYDGGYQISHFLVDINRNKLINEIEFREWFQTSFFTEIRKFYSNI